MPKKSDISKEIMRTVDLQHRNTRIFSIMLRFRILPAVALLLMTFGYKTVSATHIVGGVLNYRYVGDNNYEFTIFIYRDCINGVAPFDDPAMIEVSLGNNTEYGEYFADITQYPDTLSAYVDDPCVSEQPNVCVEYVKHIFTINLPPTPLGYIVSYSRCCRNNSILNLTRGSSGAGNEIDWGATYTINIPGGNASLLNSSPVFKNFPPIGICANKPIIFDHSATDADGDSLVYRLCNPFDGATKDNPANNNPVFVYQQPPYTPVQFQPPFSLNDMLGGIPLSIDSKTGLLTGTPTIVGQFVVGICVDEYRNGVFVTRTLRDFQYNVTDCGLQVISSFFAPSILCNDYTVSFTNQSSGAISYRWYFGDGDSSSIQNPTHTYSDTGHYTVKLVSNPGEVCSNTYSQEVSIQIKRVDAAFSVSDSNCLAIGDTLRFTDESTDLFNVSKWEWIFSTGKTDTSRNSYIIFDGTINSITATLTVTSVNGCTSTLTKIFGLEQRPTYVPPAPLQLCAGDKVSLDLSISSANPYVVSWQLGIDSLEYNNTDSLSFTPDTTQMVYYQIRNSLGCAIKDSLLVSVYPIPIADATVDQPVISIGEQVQLNTPTGNNYTYSWTPANLVSNATISNPTSSPLQTTLYSVLVSTGSASCIAEDTVSVQVINNSCNASTVFIPNSFTPNGDGVNDILWVRSANLKSLQLLLFNRWGVKVFETNTLGIGWDGNYKGQPAAQDAYGYYFKGTCLQGEEITLKGNITLIR